MRQRFALLFGQQAGELGAARGKRIGDLEECLRGGARAW